MPIKLWVIFLALITFPVLPAQAQVAAAACKADDKTCLIKTLESLTATIPGDSERDQTWRETAKLMTAAGMVDEALTIIPKIKTPDTQAMTIRGIGMAAAELKLPKEKQDAVFKQLRVEADKITHAPSHAIALTYIGMSQAFAGDDAGAMATSASMTNAALRNKAYAETAEIQAERNDLPAVLRSIAAIDDNGYKDKELFIITKIFSDRKEYAHALEIAKLVVNPYQQSQAYLYILTKQIQPDKPHEEVVTP
jgi:hypothetical protein